MNNKIKIVILAAGRGVRMESDLPKAIINLHGKALIKHLLESIKESGLDPRPTIVVGYKKDEVIKELRDDYDYITQGEQLGTGHAVASAEKELSGKYEHILVLYGDTPWVKASTMKNLVAKHLETNSKLTFGTILLQDFLSWREIFDRSFSRIVRDGNGKIIKDVQAKEATREEKKILEVNSCCMIFEATWLWDKLKTLEQNNTQKEYYLTDLVGLAIKERVPVSTVAMDSTEALAANSKEELELLENFDTIS